MNNYEFCAEWVIQNRSPANMKVLDYGCGAGHIVSLLRSADVDAYGCDVFYAGGDYSGRVNAGQMGSVIKRMDDGIIPFADASFDLVVNNQVMEHVPNLDLALQEIHRVLRPGGKVLSLFPDRGVWREGHCGVPFLHWFGKGTSPRIAYAAAWRALGFGYHKGSKSILQWSREFCEWLDAWTVYRTNREIDDAYTKYFRIAGHIEPLWLRRRLGNSRFLGGVPAPIQRMIVRRLANRVFVCEKP